MGFLCAIFSDFEGLSQTSQRKIIDCFQVRAFAPGQYLIREGELGSEAFLIKEGECSLESRKSPLTVAAGNLSSKRTVDTLIKPKRGFFSDTINKFQFGILERNQWAGEERLLKEREEPFDYSVVAMSKVLAYAISKRDAEKRLPTEFKEFLQRIVSERFRWIEERTKSLVATTRTVAQMDPSKERYDEHLRDLVKKYPAAMPNALKNIRKLQLMTKMQQKLSPKSHLNASLSPEPPQSISFPEHRRGNLSQDLTSVCSSVNSPTRKTTMDLSHCRMSNANSASRITAVHSLVPTMCRSPPLSKLANIGRAAVFGKLLGSPSGKNAGSSFAIGSRKISVQKDTAGERPTTTNPYVLALRRKTGTLKCAEIGHINN